MSPVLQSSDAEAPWSLAAPLFMSPRKDEDDFDDVDDAGFDSDEDGAKKDPTDPDSAFDDPEEVDLDDEDEDLDAEEDEDEDDDDDDDDDLDDDEDAEFEDIDDLEEGEDEPYDDTDNN
ncbi:MAG: hypothetical protein H7066_00250 [Cytophagaceae bacterium]|nr:hypothetical protein [Gemmatimonadaceae bacterium]